MFKPKLPEATPEVAKLRSMGWEELVEVFKALPCPSLEEMHGEYRGELLSLGSVTHKLMLGVGLRNPLSSWLGKGFRPVDGETGRGYNAFHRPGREDGFKFPMLTRMSLSQFDGRPVFGLVYSAFASPVGSINMIDEIRRFSDGVYLGFGICGFTEAQRAIPVPFLLYGPVDSYRGDIGTMFSGFEATDRVREALVHWRTR